MVIWLWIPSRQFLCQNNYGKELSVFVANHNPTELALINSTSKKNGADSLKIREWLKAILLVNNHITYEKSDSMAMVLKLCCILESNEEC